MYIHNVCTIPVTWMLKQAVTAKYLKIGWLVEENLVGETSLPFRAAFQTGTVPRYTTVLPDQSLTCITAHSS